MRQRKGYVMREVCGKPVIMYAGKAGEQRKVYQLSDSAAWLWQQAAEQGDFTVDSLVEALCGEYDIEPSDARADIEELLSQWKQEAIIEL